MNKLKTLEHATLSHDKFCALLEKLPVWQINDFYKHAAARKIVDALTVRQLKKLNTIEMQLLLCKPEVANEPKSYKSWLALVELHHLPLKRLSCRPSESEKWADGQGKKVGKGRIRALEAGLREIQELCQAQLREMKALDL